MSRAVITRSRDQAPQRPFDAVFLGGKPRIPFETPLPTCRLCGANQTFFLQVTLPPDDEWSGLVLALFHCTDCVDEDYLIPPMLEGDLLGAVIPAGFLDSYQVNFRFLVAEAEPSVIRDDYAERIAFQRLEMSEAGSEASGPALMTLDGEPEWLLDDETPAEYEGRTMRFLLHVMPELRFPRLEGAPPQAQVLFPGLGPPKERDHYSLFLGNAIYLFGTTGRMDPKVYAITQVD